VEILLDGREMTDRAALHDHLSDRFAFPAYYGRNLDALYDLLTAYPEQTLVTVIHTKQMLDHLGRYGIAFLQTLEDAARANAQLSISIFDGKNENKA